MSMHVEHFQISLNDEKHEALMEAVFQVGSKAAIIKEALEDWLRENGYLIEEKFKM